MENNKAMKNAAGLYGINIENMEILNCTLS